MVGIIEIVINLIFLGIFSALSILSFKLSLGIKNKLKKVGGGKVIILNVDWKSAIEDSYKLSFSTAIATLFSALIFLYYFIKSLILFGWY